MKFWKTLVNFLFGSERDKVEIKPRELKGNWDTGWALDLHTISSKHISDGRFVLLYTNSGAQSPLSHWRTYKPKEVFTQHDAWDLFFNMMEAGYVPFPGTALPQLKSAIKKQ